MKNQLADIKRVVLDYVCGAGADVLASTLESSKLVLHVTSEDALEQRLGERLQDVFDSLEMELTIELRVHTKTAMFGTGAIVYDPLKMVMTARNTMKPSARWGAAAAMMALTGGLSLSAAADLPAVSAPNGKVDINTGNYNGATGGAMVNGSFSLPLAHAFGLQVDAAAGEIINDNYNGVGAHLFWREPTKGLVGLIGATNDLNGVDLSRVGAEAKLYLSNVTLGARESRQNGDVKHGDVTRLDGSWYATDNLMINASTERATSDMSNKFTVEWQPQFAGVPGLALFASTEVAAHNYDSTIIGARYYFGTNKSLKNRHRMDDPESLVPDGSDLLTDAVYLKRKGNGGSYGGGGGCGYLCP